MQTQTTSALHNAIMEAGGKDFPPMLAPVDACANAVEMWKAIERLKQEPKVVADDEVSSKEKDIYKLMALILMSFKKIYKPTNNNLIPSSNTRNTNVDYTLRYDRGTGYMEKIQEVIPDATDNFGPIFDTKPLQKVHNSDHDYNVFASERKHPEQPEYVNDTYLVEQCDTNISSNSSYMSNNGEEAD
nr:hypothetical protein [Tanacetum cinerariifolium]GEW06097.1 hypothetical protein [Tanacetum cinerariifolium]